MERQRRSEEDRLRDSSDDAPSGDSLDQHRSEIDGLLQASDQVFDLINNPQQYLEQTLQTGGQ
jgi:hypothetical protein